MQAHGRHIVARAADGAAVGYCHYRWEVDPPEAEREHGATVTAVAYVYELQLERAARGHGLARHLMACVAAWVRAPQPPARHLCAQLPAGGHVCTHARRLCAHVDCRSERRPPPGA